MNRFEEDKPTIISSIVWEGDLDISLALPSSMDWDPGFGEELAGFNRSFQRLLRTDVRPSSCKRKMARLYGAGLAALEESPGDDKSALEDDFRRVVLKTSRQA
jgi:hypothetical protein